mmetsp:Transcript_10964/g.15238  ORF Transcript_10964/g.15238 Transcript_10964/m.15238 type:complete len:438 (+) Transcript_10964:96-1409(+)
MERENLFGHFLSLSSPALDALRPNATAASGGDEKGSTSPRSASSRSSSSDNSKKRKSEDYEDTECTPQEATAAKTDRKLRRRLQNRRAARVSRAKKKAYVTLLEEKSKKLEGQVKGLLEQNRALEARIQALEMSRAKAPPAKKQKLGHVPDYVSKALNEETGTLPVPDINTSKMSFISDPFLLKGDRDNGGDFLPSPNINPSSKWLEDLGVMKVGSSNSKGMDLSDIVFEKIPNLCDLDDLFLDSKGNKSPNSQPQLVKTRQPKGVSRDQTRETLDDRDITSAERLMIPQQMAAPSPQLLSHLASQKAHLEKMKLQQQTQLIAQYASQVRTLFGIFLFLAVSALSKVSSSTNHFFLTLMLQHTIKTRQTSQFPWRCSEDFFVTFKYLSLKFGNEGDPPVQTRENEDTDVKTRSSFRREFQSSPLSCVTPTMIAIPCI